MAQVEDEEVIHSELVVGAILAALFGACLGLFTVTIPAERTAKRHRAELRKRLNEVIQMKGKP